MNRGLRSQRHDHGLRRHRAGHGHRAHLHAGRGAHRGRRLLLLHGQRRHPHISGREEAKIIFTWAVHLGRQWGQPIQRNSQHCSAGTLLAVSRCWQQRESSHPHSDCSQGGDGSCRAVTPFRWPLPALPPPSGLREPPSTFPSHGRLGRGPRVEGRCRLRLAEI